MEDTYDTYIDVRDGDVEVRFLFSTLPPSLPSSTTSSSMGVVPMVLGVVSYSHMSYYVVPKMRTMMLCIQYPLDVYPWLSCRGLRLLEREDSEEEESREERRCWLLLLQQSNSFILYY